MPNLERRYRETESAAVREELAKYISERPCTECGGARLNRAARNVFVADRPLPHIVVLPIDEALAFFEQPQPARLARRDRGQDRQGDRRPPALPGRCRPRLPDPGAQGRHAVRRRGAAHPPGLADRRRPGRRDVRARRALDRPAPARQRAPARHAHPPARPRQHGDRGRARRGRDPPGRPHRRHRPRRRRARRRNRRAGQLRRHPEGAALAHRPVPQRQEADRDPGASATSRTRR